jgi:hypothetical protein
MIYNNIQRIGALIKGADYCVRVDAFNENGITEGTITHIGYAVTNTGLDNNKY